MKDQGFLNSENSFVINSLSQLWRIFPESRPTLNGMSFDEVCHRYSIAKATYSASPGFCPVAANIPKKEA